MSKTGYNTSVFAIGGAVQASGGIYLSRAADEELLALCHAGEFGYVLTPRQLGKTSLMVRTAERLAEEGVRSVIIDLTEIGVQVTPEEWFLGLLVKVEEQLMLKTGADGWWAGRAHQAPSQRLTAFFKEVLLEEVEGRVVIFVDEIDTTLGLSFTDDFYAAIRYFYNARAHRPEFRRLSFVLIGVATPGDLIRDPQRTPFNIGRRVDLTDFTYDEALPLASGFQLAEDETQRVLRWVLDWTDGHPYLTQRLCRAIADERRAGWAKEDVARVVSATFFRDMSEQDNNIQFVRDMLTKRAPDLAPVLNTYREVLRRPVHDEEQSVVKSHLKLSGVVRSEGGFLHVRNPIYREVFNERWVRSHLPVNWLRRLTRVAAVFLIVLMVLAIPLAIYAWSKKAAVELALQAARDSEQAAQIARQKAEDSEKLVRAFGESANAAKQEAEKARAEAFKEKEKAVAAQAEAMQQARIAKGSERTAQDERVMALRQRARAEQLSDIALTGNLGAQAQAKSIWSSSLLNDSVLLARESVAQSPKLPPLISYEFLSAGLSLLPRHVAAPLAADGHILNASFTDDSRHILTITDSRLRDSRQSYTVRVLALANGREIDSLRRTAPYRNIALDQEGKYLAAVVGDEVVSVTDLSGRAAPLTFRLSPGAQQEFPQGHPVSSDGRHLAVVGREGVRVKTVAGADEGRVLPVAQPSGEVLNSVYLSPDGKLIVLISKGSFKDGESWVAEVFEVASGRKLNTTLDSKPYSVPDVSDWVQFSRDGQYMAITRPTSVDLYAIRDFAKNDSAAPAWSTPVTNRGPAHVAFSHDGQFIAVAALNIVQVLSTLDGSERLITPTHDAPVEAISFSPDGRSIATKCHGNTVRVWRWGSKTPREVAREVARVVREVNVSSFAFSPDGKYLLTADADHSPNAWERLYVRGAVEAGGHLNVWDLSPDKGFIRRTLAESVNGTALSQDKKRILFMERVDGDPSLRMGYIDFDTAGQLGKALKAYAVVKPAEDSEGDWKISALSFNARYMVEIEPVELEASVGTKVRVSDIVSGGNKEVPLSDELTYPIAVSSNGEYFAATQITADQVSVLVFDMNTGNKVASVSRQVEEKPSVIAFSPDGRHLAAISRSGIGLIWDLKEGRLVASFAHNDGEGQILFSATGKYFVCAGGEEVLLWRRGEAQPFTLESETKGAPAVTNVSETERRVERASTFETIGGAGIEAASDVRSNVFFSADERYVAIGGSDNVTRVWETATGLLILALRHSGRVFSIALSSDGEFLATTSEGGVSQVWRVNGGGAVARLPRQAPPYDKNNIIFSTDGRYLFTSRINAGGEIQMWLWRPEDLLALSCELLPVGDPVSQVWHAYLGEELTKYLLAKSHNHCPMLR